MIHSFSCENFYSFKNKAEISFVVDKKAPDTNLYVTAPSGTRLSKIGIVVGPNASGKTHLLRVPAFFAWFLGHSITSKPNEPLNIMPFKLDNKSKNKPTNLSVTFEIGRDKNIYTYTLSLTRERVLKEELQVKKLVKQRHRTTTLFYREWDKKKRKYTIKDNGFGLSQGIKNSICSDVSVILTASRFDHQESYKIAHAWNEYTGNVTKEGWDEDHAVGISKNRHFANALDHYIEYPNLKKKVEEFIKTVERNFDSFEIQKSESGGYFVRGIYTVQDFTKQPAQVSDKQIQKYDIDMRHESAGIKQLLTILAFIFVAIDDKHLSTGGKKLNNALTVIDEFDDSAHPDLSDEVLYLFIAPEDNLNNAQILFTTHNHLLFHRVDKYNIFIVEKDEAGESTVTRLDSIEDVKLGDNYFAKYIAGDYGGLPDVW